MELADDQHTTEERMKFRAERTEFAEAVAWVRRTVGERATLPAASGIRMEVADDRLRLASTNLEMDSELSIPVQAERLGVVCVLGRLLDDISRALPQAPVEAEAESDQLRLNCGRARFELRSMAVEEFPQRPPPAAPVVVASMKAEEFAQMVGQVARAAGVDDARPVLTGVSLEAASGTLTAAATDSYRLAVRAVPWEQEAEATVLVPRRALEEARRSAELLGGEVRLALEGARATFEFGDRRLTTSLVEGKFPDFRQLIPSGFERRLQADRNDLMEVVKRVAVIGELGAQATPVTLDLTEDSVRVSAGAGELGAAEESLPGRLEGATLQIAFNPRYLVDGLDVCGGDEVVLEFRDEIKPAVLRPVGDQPAADFLYLLMPVRV